MSTLNKLSRPALLLFVLIILIAGSAMSFDGKRKGFILGIGAGPGLTIANGEYNPHLINTDFKIGGAFNEQFHLYWTSKVSWYTDDWGYTYYRTTSVTEIFGVGAIGVSYFFFPTCPSGYATAGLGYSSIMYPFEDNAPDPRFGLGLIMGLGWEFTPHLSLEGNLVSGAINYSRYDYPVWSFKVTINALAY